MRYHLILAVLVLACTTSACGESDGPTAPATVGRAAANRLLRTDTTVTVSATPPTVEPDTDTDLWDGTPGIEERNPGTIGSGN